VRSERRHPTGVHLRSSETKFSGKHSATRQKLDYKNYKKLALDFPTLAHTPTHPLLHQVATTTTHIHTQSLTTMPTTRSQGLPENEALELAYIPRTRKKTNKGSKATEVSQTDLPSSVAESPLFKLPPELRTMIYRFALHTDEDIEITESHGIPEPALLSVSKIIRSETHKVFYFENEFSCMIEHYSPATMQLARRKVSLADPRGGIRLPKTMVYHQQRHWGNLVRWLHLCLEEPHYACHTLPDDELAKEGFEYTAEERLIGGLFKFVVNDKDTTPDRLDLLLECMRPGLIAVDKDWAKY
jgi:hypothetical protein